MALNPKDALLQALQLSPDLDDEALSRNISTIITAGIDDETYRPSLKDVHDNILQYQGGTRLLEPLDVLPGLLRCNREEATNLIYLIAENSSPKEVLVVISETLEQLTQLTRENEDEDDEHQVSGAIRCLINIIAVSTKAVPRLTLGKRTSLDVVSPLVSDINALLSSLGGHFTRDSGRTLLTEISRMSEALYTWVLKTGGEANAIEAKKTIWVLLETAVTTCASCINASLCARAFEAHYPRFKVTSAVESGWKEGQRAIMSTMDALRAMALSPRDLLEYPTPISLIILAHGEKKCPLSKDLFERIFPVLVSSIKMNFILDESLYLIFCGVTQDPAEHDIPLEFAASLCSVLPALASTHLDPFIRHFSLRLVALILARLPSVLQQQILMNLATDTEFPQMRAAAIGLLKEFVLEGLKNSPLSGEQNIFASPLLLRSFGPILFKTIPSDYLSTVNAVEDIEKSLEPSRISEVLSFYYVILQRDKDNRTGVRDAGNIASVESSLLQPLRFFFEKWSNAEAKPILSLIALQIGVEKIDSAVRAIRSQNV